MESETTPIQVVIRFASALPDLPITLSSAYTSTPLSLKQEIRKSRPAETGTQRLRLIYNGKVLTDDVLISEALRLPSRNHDPKGKGKAKAVDTMGPSQFWIHCSIGDTLSPDELATEIASSTVSTRNTSPRPHGTTIPPPLLGFDRLLTASFTPTEISALRAQFMSVLAHSHTPDNMPSPAEIRVLEEQWLNEGGSDTIDGSGGAFDIEGSGYDDLIWGNIMGFFWPLGAGLWLLREEGVWTRRRQMAVLTGFCINLLFSVLRVTF
ncbi:MAG: hypothetical protein M1824_002338 [Vezdaea acicularis]|nr:MAG: hypothetical protein M1824_002338 [Vezdaea acicularis]